MRIGPFQLERVQAAEEPKPQVSKERGGSGTIIQDGYLTTDEYNPDLKGKLALKVYDRMRRSDGAVREALQHIFAPILNATWQVDPASDEPLDLEVAEFVRRSYFDWPVEPFEQTNRQTLLHLVFGHYVFETVEQVVEAELAWTDPATGAPVTAPRRQFVTWRRWADRKPATIYKWNVKDGELESITQQVWTGASYDEPTIPAESLVVFVNEKEGDDFTGMSLLRSSYKAWWLKEIAEKVMGVGIERFGVGIPTAYVPDDAKNDDAVLDRIEAMLKGLRAGEFPYLVFPGPKSTGGASSSGSSGFFFEIVTPEGGFPDFTGSLDYLRGEIKGSVLARFAELGHGSVGARATGDVQSQVWYAALHACASYMCGVHRAAIRRLVDKNYRVERYPQLVCRDIETRTLTEFADAVAKLTSSGALVADSSARAATRSAIDFPDEDEPEETSETPPKDQPDEPIEEDEPVE